MRAFIQFIPFVLLSFMQIALDGHKINIPAGRLGTVSRRAVFLTHLLRSFYAFSVYFEILWNVLFHN